MPTKPSVSISEILFSGGNRFDINENEKIILVGPNNSGKSQSLREILDICKSGKMDQTLVIKELKLSKKGTMEELKAFLENEAEYVDRFYRYKDWNLHEDYLRGWNRDFLVVGTLFQGFIKNIAANERLVICEQQKSVSPSEQKSKPQHILYDSESLMYRISELFRRAFGKSLMFDFRGGSKLPIHVGDLTAFEGVIDRVSDEYVELVRKNPLLDKQGDGMKSYAGILFEAIVNDMDITLIDEPEAFLHPPQMRKLGETLASEVKGQLLVATHSSDILRGFLEGTQGNVRILRISRENESNMVFEASSHTIKSLWEKPNLRYSNALEGIFHEQTVICEDDSDCRLINSIADYLEANSGERFFDTAYVPVGGKHGIPKVASVLREIGIPVKAVFDIDFLSEQSLVRDTVLAFGGDWSDIQTLWNRVDSAVRSGSRAKSVSEIKAEIISIVEDSNESELPKRDIQEALKQGKPWNSVKKYGDRGIPNGNAQQNYNLLREKLENIGIYLVPVGEIENFCPEVGSHGPKYVTKLLSTIPLSDERLTDLRSFVKKVYKGKHCSLENSRNDVSSQSGSLR